jgi:hypothetical protein
VACGVGQGQFWRSSLLAPFDGRAAVPASVGRKTVRAVGAIIGGAYFGAEEPGADALRGRRFARETAPVRTGT